MRYEGAFLSEADGLSISTAAMIPDQKPYRADSTACSWHE